MMTLFIAMEDALLVIRRRDGWEAHEALSGKPCRCVAADPRLPGCVYCGTTDTGLWRSDDGGDSWWPMRDGIRHPHVTAVAVSGAEDGEGGGGVVYAGTEPSAIFRSENGGDQWEKLSGLRVVVDRARFVGNPNPARRSWENRTSDPNVIRKRFVLSQRRCCGISARLSGSSATG